jgi:hypothetical protein
VSLVLLFGSPNGLQLKRWLRVERRCEWKRFDSYLDVPSCKLFTSTSVSQRVIYTAMPTKTRGWAVLPCVLPISVTCVLPGDTIDVCCFYSHGGGTNNGPKTWMIEPLFYSPPTEQRWQSIHPCLLFAFDMHARTHDTKEGISQKNISFNSFSLL